MKIVELLNKLTIPITNEESEVLGLFNVNEVIYKKDLEPRQALLANQLVNKDILLRINETGKILYKKKTS